MTTSLLRRAVTQSRGRLIIAVVLVIGLAVIVAFGEQAWKARQLQAEVAEREAAIAALQRRQDDLNQQLARYGSDAYLTYVEQIGRRDLNLSLPGETVLLINWLPAAGPAGTPQATAPAGPDAVPNWQRWLDLLNGP